ncbi:MAG: GNAT family N-acetyltransferase, partial [Acidaminococcaceae bacterium]|nr:GNAT family N-acetyltransferase [Acidaminococcaceae bacterium]
MILKDKAVIMIRNAVKEDAEKILAIYSYYVKNTAISFELDVPSLDEFQGRIV